MDKLFLLCFEALVKGQILSKPEYSFSVLSAKKSGLSECFGAKGVWENHCSAFTHLLSPQAWGSADNLLWG